jgi:dTDP-4-amino-4,6-dideoxygalactose transaminase
MSVAAPTTQQRIPLVDLRAQYDSIRGEVDAAIERVLQNTSFILGKEVAAFEAAFASYVGTSEAVGIASGTGALELSLRACGVGEGHEVITTAHTFTATGEAIWHAGARPVFVDIDPVDFCLDPERVEAAITPRTRAIMPVHLYGQPADMSALLDIARRHDLRVVEDAAQAHGAAINSSGAGSIGDLGCFSFYPGKNLGAYGDAGAVTGSDAELVARVRLLRDHGRTTKYEHEAIGFGERLDALQAAILAAKLPHLPAWTEARRQHAERYRSLLAELPLGLPVERPGRRHVYHLFVVRSPRRDELAVHLRDAGVDVGIHYPIPLHMQPAYAELGYNAGDLPETEQAASEVLSLPMYPELSESQIERVADAVGSFAW